MGPYYLDPVSNIGPFQSASRYVTNNFIRKYQHISPVNKLIKSKLKVLFPCCNLLLDLQCHHVHKLSKRFTLKTTKLLGR